jgi:hypothetical protein
MLLPGGGGGGGVIYPHTGFLTTAPKLLGIFRNASVTFPEYGWATKRKKNSSDISNRFSNMAAGIPMYNLKTNQNISTGQFHRNGKQYIRNANG